MEMIGYAVSKNTTLYIELPSHFGALTGSHRSQNHKSLFFVIRRQLIRQESQSLQYRGYYPGLPCNLR